ncbi:molybdate ABC transporter substrate-binding protein [Pseudomonas sp. F1_0610]|uniref:molybdate ABC transporter substrate-binding protein n=1 Tax=Pseudomonas sp. F1_0610 TaxID=3114284 RepID=UPI0039C14E6E
MASVFNTLASAVILIISTQAMAEEITVSAAASLTNAFTDIASKFEQAYPEHKVQLNFAASGALLQQMAQGAPVDIFASADQKTMDDAQQKQLIANHTRQDFVRNSLVVITPTDSQLNLKSLQELNQPAIKHLAISNPESVPVGRYSQQALEKAQLWTLLNDKKINTESVRQSLDYVARGEVDAGFVYSTDAAIMPDKVKVQFTVPLDVVISYPIAITQDGTKKAASSAFVEFLFKEENQALLSQYGFSKP